MEAIVPYSVLAERATAITQGSQQIAGNPEQILISASE
jgi:hypothetical protein